MNCGGDGGDDGGVVHGAVATQGVGHECDGGFLLADGHVEALHVAALLGEDGVDADRSLADLTVADDELALAAANRGHGVDGLEAGHHGLMDRLTGDDAGGLQLDGAGLLGGNGAETVDGVAERVDDAAENGFANGHGEDLTGTLDRVAFLDVGAVAQKRDTNVILFEVEHHALETAGELQELHGHGVFHAMHAGDAVSDVQNGAGLAHFHAGLVILDLSLNDYADFFRFDLHGPTHPS